MAKTINRCSMMFLAVSLCGAVAVAQDCLDWIDRNQTPRDGFELVFDSARGVVVRPGEAVWEWDGATWVRKGLSGPGGTLGRHAAAYDAERGVTLMHGGSTNQTWAYDGSDWQLVSVDGPALNVHAMAFDSARDVVVLFGGRDPDGNNRGDTWEWDGQDWTRVSTTGPAPRRAHRMAYDSVRGVTVLYGGSGQGSTNDTWEWDGQDWALVDADAPFPWSGTILLTYDSARAVTLLQHQREHETWTWDGAEWTFVGLDERLPHSGGGLAFDSARGVGVLVTPYSTWEWNGVNWEEHRLALPQEGDRSMAFDSDRGVTVLYLGTQETWEWDGRELVLRATEGPPTGNESKYPMVYDRARGEMFLFDGNDTWTWDGEAWTMKQVSNPPRRTGARIAYDEQAELVIMHGGTSPGERNDTWVWNGSIWTLVDESGPPRERHAMAYNSDRGVVLMFGGVGSGDWQNDTWEWNGQAWTQISDVGPLVFGHAMAYDASAGLMRVFGGYVKDGARDDLWSWDGQDWTLGQFNGEIPPGERYPSMVYDSSRAVMVVRSGNPGRLWELGCPCPADLTGDGLVNTRDFIAFLSAWANGDDIADWNEDGTVNTQDFIAYLNDWAAGC